MSPYKGNRVTTTGQYIHAAPRDHTANHATLCRPGGWLLPPTSEGKRPLALVWPSEEPITCNKCLGIIALAYDDACIVRSLIARGVALAMANTMRWAVYFSENPYFHFTDQDVEDLLPRRKRVFDEALLHKDVHRLAGRGQQLTDAARELHELINEQERRAQFGDVRPLDSGKEN